MHEYYVYIMASRSRVLYTGVTSDLQRRAKSHIEGTIPGFTSRYRVNRLVYFEVTRNIRAAIAREKQIKGWLRRKKIALIESVNAEWKDLTEALREEGGTDPQGTHPDSSVGRRPPSE